MRDYQRDFIQFAIENKVLRFGKFALKSGRISPYFFNLGLFNTGASLAKLGKFYASAITHADPGFDILFGPAYKGIPIVSTTAIALSEHFGRDIPFAFNRKEPKPYGEGGELIGAPLKGDVLILDDVITMGNTIRDVEKLIAPAGAKISGIVIALDRSERGQGETSAVQEVAATYGVPVISIISLHDLIEYLQEQEDSEDILQRIADYQKAYC